MSDFRVLRRVVTEFGRLTRLNVPEHGLLSEGSSLLAALIAEDDWLPAEFARPSIERYQQYLLHCDSDERFSIVSFVWGPGQSTPIHDHTVWGLVGVMRGAEQVSAYIRTTSGRLEPAGEPSLATVGQIEAVSPRIGDIHQVSNAFTDRVSVSIHVYGANIGAVERSVYQPDGTAKRFVSGYANNILPNIWN